MSPGALRSLILAVGACLSTAGAWTAEIKTDESVLLLPTMAWPGGAPGEWEFDLEARVFEVESRRLTLGLLQRALGWGGVELTAAERACFAERCRWFLVDGERRKRLRLRVGGVELPPQRSDEAGRVAARLTFVPAIPTERGTVRLALEAVLPARDPRRFAADLWLLPAEGVTVVSDVDDTLKISDVRERRALLANTFLRPFRPVEGMSDVFRSWAGRHGADFLYLSASPWPLYPALSAFARTNGFPEGAWLLKDFHWSRDGVAGLFESPDTYKTARLDALLRRWPKREWVLVGDSGERDPEIYGDVARRHPGRVRWILIRDVTREGTEAARYREAFRELGRTRWRVFGDPGALRDVWELP